MKKNTRTPAGTKQKPQSNIGYENTKKTTNSDDRENNRVKTTKTGHGEGPKENEDDTEGLRSESGSKSLGKQSGNKERG
jgi:hypothetical protein